MVDSDVTVNVERYRQRWEPDAHWAMRRDFIVRHSDKFSHSRLLCLSQVFVNVELLGCTYPAAVMNLVRELSKDVDRPVRESAAIPKFSRVSFVRAGEGEQHDPVDETLKPETTNCALPKAPQGQSFGASRFSRAGLGSDQQKRKGESATGSIAKFLKLGSAGPTNAGASPDALPGNGAAHVVHPQPKFRELADLIKGDTISGANVLDKLQQAVAKSHLVLSCEFSNGAAIANKQPMAFECRVLIGGTVVASASAANKKEAKRLACQSAWDMFRSTVSRPGFPEVQHSVRSTSAPSLSSQQQRLNVGSTKLDNGTQSREEDGRLNFETFVILENQNSSLEPVSILHTSAAANKLRCSFEDSFDGTTHFCTVVLGQCEVRSGSGESKQEAKEKAAAESLSFLRELVPTLRMKRLVDGCGPEVTKTCVGNPGVKGAQERISSENIGHKLLKLMGWTGGGVGKEGVGIVEPVMLKETSRREGLGFASAPGTKMSPIFKSKVHEVLKEFSRTVVLQDLVFSAEFDNDERKFIHTVAHKFGLKSISRDGASGRFLTVRHKLSVQELVSEIMRTGPTDKYELFLPGDVGRWHGSVRFPK